jgi:hypothetical protein
MPPVNCSSSASVVSSPSALPSSPCWRRCAKTDRLRQTALRRTRSGVGLSSRYTHRVAIANSRLIAFDKNTVSFKYKDNRLEGPDRYKVMTLATDEFIRHFLIHVLPKGLHRIRHYGLFAKAACVDRARQLLGAKSPKAILPIVMMATRRPPARALAHAAAVA